MVPCRPGGDPSAEILPPPGSPDHFVFSSRRQLRRSRRGPPPMSRHLLPLPAWLACVAGLPAQEAAPLPGTRPLTEKGDFSDRMLAGIEKFLLRETAASVEGRRKLWKRDFSSRSAYEKSV